MKLTLQSTKSTQWINQDEYPFKRHYYTCEAGKMHYVDEGVGDPIVFIHGNPCWSFTFRHLIKGVSKTHRCIAPDLLGFGLSDKPMDWAYTPKQHAENISRLLNELQLTNITLVVNDWGGPIGLWFAEQYPEKIKKLVIFNTWLWPVNNDWYYRMFSGFMGGFIGRYLIKNYNFFANVIVKKAFGNKELLTKDIHSHYLLPLQDPNERKGCYVFPKQIIAAKKWLEGLWEQRFKINKIPTTFIWGMKDIAFREKELNYWIANWDNKKVIRLPEVGHFPQEEAPDVVIKELLST